MSGTVRGTAPVFASLFVSLAFAATAQAQAPDEQPSEVVITGSRIIGNGDAAPSPVTVLGADQLEKLGSLTVLDALQQLPAFRNSSSSKSNTTSSRNLGLNLVDLRGLDPTRTLVLVDGRRFVPSSSTATVDVNLIPSNLIQRVDIVTGGASAAYGSDAVAGVANFVLDTKLAGLRASLSYGQSSRHDNEQTRAGLAGGADLFGGRGHVVGAIEFERQRAVGSCYTRDWCTERGLVTNATRGTNGLPASVLADDVHLALATPAGLITTTNPAVRGIQFLDSGGIAPNRLVYGQLAGTSATMIGGGIAGETAFTDTQLINPYDRWSALTHATFDITDSLKTFVELSYGENTSESIGAATLDSGTITIRNDNAYLPQSIKTIMANAGLTSIALGRLTRDIGSVIPEHTNRTGRILVGLQGPAWGEWLWDAYAQRGKAHRTELYKNNRITARWNEAIQSVIGPNGTPVCSSTLTNPNNGCQPLNLFGQFQYSPAAYAYTFGTGSGERYYTQDVVSANVQGPVFEGWAGPLTAAMGLEYRRENSHVTFDAMSLQNAFFIGNGTNLDGTIEVREGYLEAQLPVAKNLPFVESLELNAAIRATDYTTSGNVTTWKFGAVYDIAGGVRLRGTRSRDIRAPNVTEFFSPLGTTQANVTNRQTGVSTLTRIFTGGNTDLTPEEADTTTFGIVFNPSAEWLQGFRASVDYYSVEINDAISTLGAQIVEDRCVLEGRQEFCAYIDRTPALINSVTLRSLNLNSITTKGIDIDAGYTFALAKLANALPGELSLRAVVGVVNELTICDSGGCVDRAGQTGPPGASNPAGIPELRGNLIATYNLGKLSTTIEAQYIDSGTYDATRIGPDDPAYTPFLVNSISENLVSSATYVNFAAQYWLTDQLQVFGGVQNLLDRSPPGNSSLTNNQLFDNVGRNYNLGIRYRH